MLKFPDLYFFISESDHSKNREKYKRVFSEMTLEDKSPHYGNFSKKCNMYQKARNFKDTFKISDPSDHYCAHDEISKKTDHSIWDNRCDLKFSPKLPQIGLN